MTIPSAEPTVSRRLLAKGAAWAVPAAAAVAVAPAVAASPGSLNITSPTAAGCTYTVVWQGKAGKSYKVEYLDENNVVLHTTASVTANSSGAGTDSWTSTAGPVAKIVVTILNETPVVSASATFSVPSAPVLTLGTVSGNTRNWSWTGPSGSYTFYYRKKSKDTSYVAVSVGNTTAYQSTGELYDAYVSVAVCGRPYNSNTVIG